MKKIVIITALTVLLSGCVFSQSYPDSWSAIDLGVIQSKLLGREFECKGVFLNDGGAEIDTTIFNFIDFELSGGNICDKFSLHISRSSDLEIIFEEYGAPFQQKVVFSVEEYKVIDGWIYLPKNREFVNKEGVLAYTSVRNMLSVTENGSLVVKFKGLGAGLMLLVPYVGLGNNWARFDKI